MLSNGVSCETLALVRAEPMMSQKSSETWRVAFKPSAKPHAAVASMMSSEMKTSVHRMMLHKPCRLWRRLPLCAKSSKACYQEVVAQASGQ